MLFLNYYPNGKVFWDLKVPDAVTLVLPLLAAFGTASHTAHRPAPRSQVSPPVALTSPCGPREGPLPARSYCSCCCSWEEPTASSPRSRRRSAWPPGTVSGEACDGGGSPPPRGSLPARLTLVLDHTLPLPSPRPESLSRVRGQWARTPDPLRRR